MITRLLAAALLLLLAAVAHADSGSQPPGASLVYRVYLSGSAAPPPLPTLVFSYSDGRPSVTVTPCASAHPLLYMTDTLVGYIPPVPTCGWMMIVDASSFFTNIAFPDTGAVYWVTSFQLDPALTISVRGRFPDSRYMSFNVYDATHSSFSRNGVASGLADYLIAPDAGSANPWQQPATAGGAYTLRVVQNPAPGSQNQLPMPDAVSSSGTGLPPPCTGSDCPPLNEFVGPASTGGLAPNVDNAYIAALFQPVPGQVLVVRGRMPAAPAGYYATHPVPWPSTTQLRYWSLCDNKYELPYPVVVNTTADGSTTTGCIADYQTALDASGYYTVVVSAPADRPRNADAAHGASWIPESTDQPLVRHMLLMRNMLPEQFAQAIQNVPADNDPASAAAVMQDYYPRIASCTREIFELGGWRACAGR